MQKNKTEKKITKEIIVQGFKKFFTKENLKAQSIDFIFILLGCCMGAFAVVSVMIPNGLTTGGLTGIVRILQKFINIDFSIMYYIGAGIILVISAILLGLREAKKIVLLSVLYPTVMLVFEKLDFGLLEEKDILLASVFCGVFMGISNGIVFWRGYSYASTDAIAKIIKKFMLPHMSLSSILLAIDALVILGSAFVFDRNIALYALISQVISTKVVEMVIYGFETKIVQVDVITEKNDELCSYVLDEIQRGVSSKEVCGEYTQSKYRMLSILCSPRESILIKRFLAKHDPKAFVTVVHVDTVWGDGHGFKDISS